MIDVFALVDVSGGEHAQLRAIADLGGDMPGHAHFAGGAAAQPASLTLGGDLSLQGDERTEQSGMQPAGHLAQS